MKKWEYRVDINIGEEDDEFDKLGREGWELVSVVFSNNNRLFYFKREMQ